MESQRQKLQGCENLAWADVFRSAENWAAASQTELRKSTIIFHFAEIMRIFWRNPAHNAAALCHAGETLEQEEIHSKMCRSRVSNQIWFGSRYTLTNTVAEVLDKFDQRHGLSYKTPRLLLLIS